MKILVASGSFKDVYSSIEACDMFCSFLAGQHEVRCFPVCDGGEYTLDVLLNYYGARAKVETVEAIHNPYGKCVSVRYLAVDGAAYLVSAEILHLTPAEDAQKDPRHLSDFGLGELIADALRKGYRDIRLCLGGTSTIGYGIGAAQALGAQFFDADHQELPEPLCPFDYPRIARAVWHAENFRNVHLTLINDGNTRACNLATVNPLKIGHAFAPEAPQILAEIETSCQAVYRFTGLTRDDPWSGNGGGVYFGLEPMFHPAFVKGAEYFCELFGLSKAMSWADLVVTGEGRFDNPHLKKIPLVVAELAKQQGKPVLFACGEAAPEWVAASTAHGEGVYTSPELSEQYGITQLLSCAEYYASHPLTDSDRARCFARLTPQILKQRFQQTGVIS